MFPECNLVGPDDPAYEDHREGVEAHKGGVDGPFAFDDAGVEDHQAWDGLQTDEGGSGHLPGIVALVEPVWLGGHGEGVALGMESLRRWCKGKTGGEAKEMTREACGEVKYKKIKWQVRREY